MQKDINILRQEASFFDDMFPGAFVAKFDNDSSSLKKKGWKTR